MKVGDLIRLTGTSKMGIVMNVDKYDSYQNNRLGCFYCNVAESIKNL